MNRAPDALDRLAPLFEPPARTLEDVVRRRHERERHRKIGAIALAAIIAVAFAGAAVGLVGRGRQPARHPGVPFERIHGWIVYLARSGDLVAVDPLDPTNRISFGYAHGLQPVGWSQDGNRLLGREEIDGFGGRHSTLYVVRSGGAKIRITTPGGATWGSFSPDGTRVVYTDPDRRGLYTIDAVGGESRRIFRFNEEPFIESPAWSPDGSRIAVLDFLEGSSDAYGLVVVNDDGSGRAVEIEDLGIGASRVAEGLVWSPDGSRLAFFSFVDGARSARIYVVDADSWTVQQITHGGDSRWPTWAPDGSRLAFVQDEQLYTARPDGSDLQRVDGVVLGPSASIAWNPGTRA
jgi:Tol biopolymer transport system component